MNTELPTSKDIIEDDITKAPKPNAWDAAHQVVKIALSAVSGLASLGAILATGVPISVPLADFWTTFVPAPLAKRMVEWMELLARKIVEVKSKVENFNIEDLSNNDSFISAAQQATSIALRNHKKEKLEALANAVINIALSNSVQEDMKFMLLHLVDRVTPSHISILKYFDNPFEWMKERNAEGMYMKDGWIENFDEAFPDFKGNRYALYWTVEDLSNVGLLREKVDSYYTTHQLLPSQPFGESAEEQLERKLIYQEKLRARNLIDITDIEITMLGQSFLQFISNPVELNLNHSSST